VSDTGDLSRTEAGEHIMAPSWLYDMPDEWFEAYLEVSQTCAVVTRWGHA